MSPTAATKIDRLREVSATFSRPFFTEREEARGHDQRFKEFLRAFLRDFLKLFYPRVEKRLDFHNIEFLDTEIFTDLHDGSRREADVVAKLRSRDGRPELVRGLAIEEYLVSASRLPSSRLVSTKVDAWVSARTTSGIRKCRAAASACWPAGWRDGVAVTMDPGWSRNLLEMEVEP